MEIDAKKIIELNSLLNNLTEGFDEIYYNRKFNLTLKDKCLIFLYDKNKSPYELIKNLGVAKSNLALISAELIKNDFIKKERDDIDRRNIVLSLTQKGRTRVEEILTSLNKNINTTLSFKNNQEKVNELVVNLLNLLS